MKNYLIYVPNTVVCLRHVVQKVITFYTPTPIQKVHQLSARGDVLPFVWGLKGCHSPHIANNTCEGLKLLQVNLKVTCKNAEKTLTLSQSIEKLQHFEISLMDKAT
jgi:hypothetical protein